MIFFNFKLEKHESIFNEIISSHKDSSRIRGRSEKGLYFFEKGKDISGIYYEYGLYEATRSRNPVSFRGKLVKKGTDNYFKGIIFFDPIIYIVFTVLVASLLKTVFQDLKSNSLTLPLSFIFLVAVFLLIYHLAAVTMECYKELESITQNQK